MRSRLLRRRFATAVGTYLSVAFGVVGTLVAARVLGPQQFGVYSIVLVATSFFQVLLDVTVEEALVKFGFRYTANEDWGRLQRLFRRVIRLKAIGVVLARSSCWRRSPTRSSVPTTSRRRFSSPRCSRSFRRPRASRASR
jgi:O-antigen/teichoic acid export membrane protein